VKFKIDENLPVETANLLRAAGHEADTVQEEGLTGSEDGPLSERIRLEDRAIVTLDLDFSGIRAYPPQDCFGIAILRPSRQDIASFLALVRRILPLLNAEPLVGNIWIVEPDRIRIRPGRVLP
jgi:predicted nuclease of predicted toxin-antitoxin system